MSNFPSTSSNVTNARAKAQRRKLENHHPSPQMYCLKHRKVCYSLSREKANKVSKRALMLLNRFKAAMLTLPIQDEIIDSSLDGPA